MAKDIAIGDLLISSYNNTLSEDVVSKKLNSDQHQILLGSILGDGSLSKSPCGRYRLKFVHGEAQEEYIKWKARMFDVEHLNETRTGYTNSKKFMCSTRSIDLHNDYDVSDRKSCPQWVIDELDTRGIAVWFMDDGSINKKVGCINIHSNSFDLDSHERFRLKFESMGISCRIQKIREYYQLAFGLEDSKRLLKMIIPYIHKSISYKVENDRFITENTFDGIDKYSYSWDNKFLDYGLIRVSDTKKYTQTDKRVYDLEVEDNHTFVCSSKSLCGPVVHNCHHVPAESFSKAMYGTSFKYVIGLTATPFRKDGLSRVLFWFFGKIAYEVRRTGQENVLVKVTPFSHVDYSQPPPINRRGDLDYTGLITKICNIPDRTDFIADEAKRLADSGRNVLVLSHRRGHAISICEKLKELGVDAGTYLGGDKTAPDVQVTCATYSLASEGYDNPKLNGLVLATPSSDVVQACGRILRGGNGNDPVIVDVVDQYSLFFSQLAKRKTFYKRIGFRVIGEPKKEVEEITQKLDEVMFVDDD